jgi:RimJ/RimL family protein N-acetyltransferase
VRRITSLGFRTDVALRVLEGAAVTDRGDYLVVRSPGHPDFWWGNFLLLACWPGPGTGDSWLARFAAEFPLARHVAIGVDSTGEDGAGVDGAGVDGAGEDGAGEDAAGVDGAGEDAADVRGVTPAEFLAAGLEPQRDTVLTCAAVGPPPHPSAAAEIRRLESDADWQQSVELTVRCFGPGESRDYLEDRTAVRRRLTQAGRGAWFGAFAGRRLLAQLGLFDAGHGHARYQHVETDPEARRRGLAGTLVWHAGRYGREVLGASTFVIVADPADVAIRVYRACGFADRQRQFGFERPPAD